MTKRPENQAGWQWLALIASGLILCGGILAQEPGLNLPRLTKPDSSFSKKDLKRLLSQPPVRDRITDEELAAIKQKHRLSYGRGFEPTRKQEMPPRGDLYATSLILSDGKNHTILPRNSLLHIPEKYQHRVVEEPVGRLVLWPDFQKRHRTWILTREVTMANATGDQPIPAERLEGMKNLKWIVVSVLGGHPISVMPPAIPETDALTLNGPSSPDGGEKASPAGSRPSTQSKYRKPINPSN